MAEAMVTLPPRDYRDAIWLSRFYQAAGDNARAEAMLRFGIDQAGHTPDTWIAWMGYLQQSNRRSEALAELERMKKELSASRQPLTIARCYEALQMDDETTTAYEEALRKAPEDDAVRAFAGDYWARRANELIRSGNLNDARRMVDRLDVLEPDSPRARELRKALNK
jgi:tetratricopeptide (TPR) repeat protein